MLEIFVQNLHIILKFWKRFIIGKYNHECRAKIQAIISTNNKNLQNTT